MKSKNQKIKKIISENYLTFILTVIFLIFSLVGLAQSVSRDEAFRQSCKTQFHLVYAPPAAYYPLENQPNLLDLSQPSPYFNVYFIESKIDKVIIGTYILPLSCSNLASVDMQFLFHINSIRKYNYNKKEIANSFVIYPNEISENLNSNFSGEYSFYMKKSFMGKYNYCSVRFLQVSKEALIFTFHLFERNKPKLIQKTLESTINMIKFDEAFSKNVPYGDPLK
jgi:hypothetical protein